MVIADIRPLISSCLMLACLWSPAIDRICPCSVYSRSDERLHADASSEKATATEKNVRLRMHLVYIRGTMIWVGTSGYNYPEWKGSFYPADLPAAKMLPYYAARFPTVEINYTFYRMPNEKLVAGWAAQTPSPYKLTLKAPRRITHDSRLRNAGDLVHAFCGVAGTLGDKLGALLFQLPPNFKKDLAVFDAFLDDLPPKVTGAFEFRHDSWLDEDVFERLARRDLA